MSSFNSKSNFLKKLNPLLLFSILTLFIAACSNSKVSDLGTNQDPINNENSNNNTKNTNLTKIVLETNVRSQRDFQQNFLRDTEERFEFVNALKKIQAEKVPSSSIVSKFKDAMDINNNYYDLSLENINIVGSLVFYKQIENNPDLVPEYIVELQYINESNVNTYFNDQEIIEIQNSSIDAKPTPKLITRIVSEALLIQNKIGEAKYKLILKKLDLDKYNKVFDLELSKEEYKNLNKLLDKAYSSCSIKSDNFQFTFDLVKKDFNASILCKMDL